jgi:hypothetical protein
MSRTQGRLLTRLTNAFGKKWIGLSAAYLLWFGYYNFCRLNQSLRDTPALEAGWTTRVWMLGELPEAA